MLMGSNPSILKLIIQRVLLIAVLYTLCIFLIINAQIRSTVNTVQTNLLTSRLWEVASYLSRDAEHQLVLNIPKIRSAFYATPGIDYIIRDQQKNILFHSQKLINYSPPKTPDKESIYEFSFLGPDGSTFVGQSGWIYFENKPYLVQVTQSEDVASEFPVWLSHVFLYKVALLGIPFMFALVFSVIYTIKKSLLPITNSSKQAQVINFSTPGMRLQIEGVPNELTPLIQAFNDVLMRFEAGISAQKDFTANAAHELRTPLSILQARINLLQDSDVKERLRSDVAKMNRLVEQLLAAARLDYPGHLQMEKADLTGIVRDACLDIWPLMLEHNLLLEVKGVTGPIWINANYDATYRALRNILENALHYAPPSTPVIVELAVQNSFVHVRVCDNGPGIPSEDKDRIFERFWRKDSKQGNGAGIGLYIVKTTMNLHQGAVHVEDNPAGGSSFILTFPISHSLI